MTELETQAQEQLNAIYGGTNPEEAEQESEQEIVDDETQEESEEEIQDDTQEEEELEEETQEPKSKKEKTEERFKKILSKKNWLADRVSELENMLADEKFYKQFPQAESMREEINEKLWQYEWMTREDAFYMLSWRKWTPVTRNWLLGDPAKPQAPKSTNDMSTKELEAFVKDNKVLENALWM